MTELCTNEKTEKCVFTCLAEKRAIEMSCDASRLNRSVKMSDLIIVLSLTAKLIYRLQDNHESHKQNSGSKKTIGGLDREKLIDAVDNATKLVRLVGLGRARVELYNAEQNDDKKTLADEMKSTEKEIDFLETKMAMSDSILKNPRRRNFLQTNELTSAVPDLYLEQSRLNKKKLEREQLICQQKSLSSSSIPLELISDIAMERSKDLRRLLNLKINKVIRCEMGKIVASSMSSYVKRFENYGKGPLNFNRLVVLILGVFMESVTEIAVRKRMERIGPARPYSAKKGYAKSAKKLSGGRLRQQHLVEMMKSRFLSFDLDKIEVATDFPRRF